MTSHLLENSTVNAHILSTITKPYPQKYLRLAAQCTWSNCPPSVSFGGVLLLMITSALIKSSFYLKKKLLCFREILETPLCIHPWILSWIRPRTFCPSLLTLPTNSLHRTQIWIKTVHWRALPRQKTQMRSRVEQLGQATPPMRKILSSAS
jgi:hypothetical protein